MLRRTFLHLPGIGEHGERKLWASGASDWPSFLEAHGNGRLRTRRHAELAPQVEESIRRYDAGDWTYFDQRLPSNQKWRAFGDFPGRALYVDIETTGMMGGDSITVIGLYDGRDCRCFVQGRDLEQALDMMEAYPLVVTFNGASFDMPLIRERFRHNRLNHVHIDLRFPLKALGYSGGLKRIEQAMGISRSGRTSGLDGWDAVRLWGEYQRGRAQSLDILLEYNQEDIRNLEPLMRFVYEQMSARLAS